MTFYGSIYMRPNDQCWLREKFADSTSCIVTKPHRSISETCRIWACDHWLPNFLGTSDCDVPVMMRRYFSFLRRANCFASLNTRHEKCFRHHQHVLQFGDMSQHKQDPSKSVGFWGRKSTPKMKSTPYIGEKNLALGVFPLVAFWRMNYVWPTYGPNGLAMT